MSPIKALTADQKAQLPIYRDKWMAIGLSTEPANREVAEEGIRLAYLVAGWKTPRIIWCGSPLSQGLTRAIILDKNVWNSVGASVGDSVWDSVWASVGASVWDSVGDSVRDSVGDSVWDSIWDSVGASVWASVGASVWDSVWASVRDSVGDSVRDSVGDSVGASVRDSVRASGYGQHDANWLAFYEYFREVCGLKQQTEKLRGLMQYSKNAGWFLPHRHICWLSERHHRLCRDDRGRLHNLTGPAVAYPDGWSIYAVHGVRVLADIIERPELLTVGRIEKEPNVEVRRVMVERMGYERFVLESGAQLVDSDKTGALYRKELPNDEPLVVVHVVNATPEPDQTLKKYMLRVPPDMKTARQAVAWTFGLKQNQYQPTVET